MANQKDLELFLKGVKAWNEGVENGGLYQQGLDAGSIDSPGGAPTAHPPDTDAKPLSRFRAVPVPVETPASGRGNVITNAGYRSRNQLCNCSTKFWFSK